MGATFNTLVAPTPVPEKDVVATPLYALLVIVSEPEKLCAASGTKETP